MLGQVWPWAKPTGAATDALAVGDGGVVVRLQHVLYLAVVVPLDDSRGNGHSVEQRLDFLALVARRCADGRRQIAQNHEFVGAALGAHRQQALAAFGRGAVDFDALVAQVRLDSSVVVRDDERAAIFEVRDCGGTARKRLDGHQMDLRVSSSGS